MIDPPVDTTLVPALDDVLAAPTPRPGLLVVWENGAPACHPVPFDGEPLVVGRAPSSGLLLADRTVSSRHAKIAREGGRVVVEDLAGRGTTFVDGRQVVGRAEVERATVVRVGAALLLVVDDVAPFEARAVVTDGDYVIGPAHHEALEAVRSAARSGLTLLITGESGTGKENAARWYHASTGRRGELEAVNSTMLRADRVESQLFGHKKGAFTGADRDHRGAIVRAQGGTVFFDEIGDLAGEVQPKLLRVLQDRCVLPMGSEQPVRVDVRFVSATLRDVRAQVAGGALREDLYVRLSEEHVHLPPLRERREEIPHLVALAARQLAPTLDAPPPPIGPTLVEACLLRSWRGENVRGLLRTVKQAILAAARAKAPIVGALHLPAAPAEEPAPQPSDAEKDAARLRAALPRHGGNVTKAAAELGIPRSTAFYLVKKYGR